MSRHKKDYATLSGEPLRLALKRKNPTTPHGPFELLPPPHIYISLLRTRLVNFFYERYIFGKRGRSKFFYKVLEKLGIEVVGVPEGREYND